jgi:RHS repeat-associated protein
MVSSPDPCPPNGPACGCGSCVPHDTLPPPKGVDLNGSTPSVQVLPLGSAPSGVHWAVTARPGEGEFHYFSHDVQNGGLQNVMEVRRVDGGVIRSENAGVVRGKTLWRPIEIVDPYDNRTVIAYYPPGHPHQNKVFKVSFPGGIDKIYDYSPAWIGPAPWDATNFAGIEIRYEDRSVPAQSFASRRQCLLFKKRRDLQGNLVPWTRPYAGDLLYRIYGEEGLTLPDLANVGANTLFQLPGATSVQVVEYGYIEGTALLASVSQFVATGIQSTQALNPAEVEVVYEYGVWAGRARVSKETFPREGLVNTYDYTVDVSGQHLTSIYCVNNLGRVWDRKLDDGGRVISEQTIAPNTPAGKPRLSDPDNGGVVESTDIDIRYEYAPCGACGGKVTACWSPTTGRRVEYDYDNLTGLLLESRDLNLSGSAAYAVTRYSWSPVDANAPYAAYHLNRITLPDQSIVDYTYNLVPRSNPDWGSKAESVTVTSPTVTRADATTVAVSSETHFNITSTAPGAQASVVGQVTSSRDGDGVITAFTYDPIGRLRTTVVNPTGTSDRVETETVFDHWGDLLSVTENVGSSQAKTATMTYDGRGQLSALVVSGQGLTAEEEFYYDRWGHLAVHRRKNANSSGGQPDDFGPSPRSDTARQWLRDEWHYDGQRPVVAFQDRRTLDRDDNGTIADVSDARFLRTDMTWSQDGQLTLVGNTNGSTTSFVYDGYGALYKAETATAGQPSVVQRFYCNAALEVVRSIRGTGADQLVTTVERNGAGVVEKMVEPSVLAPTSWYPGIPAWATYEFDTDVMGNTVERRVLDRASVNILAKVHTTYDQLGRAYRVDAYDVANAGNPLQTSTVLWDGASLPKKVVGPAGRKIVRTFDALGRVRELADDDPLTAGSQLNRVSYSYVANCDAVGQVTRQSWDWHPTAPVNPVLLASQYIHDGLGRVVEMRVGPTTSATTPPTSPLVHHFSYYSSGQTESYVDPAGKVEKYLPDALGRLAEHYLPGTQAIWNETRYSDYLGADARTLVEQTDGRGRLTKTFYDFAGRVQAILEPGAAVEPTAASPNQPFAKFFTYDARGFLAQSFAGDGIVVQHYRDGMGRMIARSSPTPSLASAVSWLHGRDIVVRDALGRITYSGSLSGANGTGGVYVQESREYDGLGRATAESFNFLTTSNWVKIGSSYTGADPFRTGLSYENQLGANTGDLAMQFLPDAIGRMQEVSWQTVGSMRPVATYLHQGGATRRRVTSWGASTGQNFDTDYRYDSYGRMDRITQSFDAQAKVEFTYDAASNLVKEIYDGHLTATTYNTRKGDRFAYDEHHRLSKAWLGSDQNHMNQADPEAATGGEPVGDFVKKLTYGLDAANNRSSVSAQIGLGGTPSTATYTTDNTAPESNRYVAAEGVGVLYDQRGNTAFDGNYYYVYDEQNRLSEVYILVETDMAQAGAQTMLATDPTTGSTSEVAAQGKFVVSNPDALKNARASILARASANLAEFISRHDERAYAAQFKETLSPSAVQPEEGTQSSSSSSSPVFDVTQMQLVAFYLYDVHDRRVVRMVMGTWDTRFTAWDGWQEAQELSLASGPLAVPEKQFMWGEQLDELVAYRTKTASGWNEYYVAEGGAHCPQRILNTSGAVVEAQEYDPYGKTTFFGASGSASVSAVGNPFGWKAVRIDPETGLLYMRHRYYSAKWGRFLSQDPLGVWGDSAAAGNDYSYGGSNPLTFSDPFGLQVWGAVAKAVAKVGIKKAAKELAERALRTILLRVAKRGVKRKLRCLDEVGDMVDSIVGVMDGSWGDFVFELIPVIGDVSAGKRLLDAWSLIEKKFEKIEKAIKNAKVDGLIDNIADHEKKLKDYIRDPMASDNRGLLKYAVDKGDSALYNQIYHSRIKSLEGQIDDFDTEISKKIREELAKLGGL